MVSVLAIISPTDLEKVVDTQAAQTEETQGHFTIGSWLACTRSLWMQLGSWNHLRLSPCATPTILSCLANPPCVNE